MCFTDCCRDLCSGVCAFMKGDTPCCCCLPPFATDTNSAHTHNRSHTHNAHTDIRTRACTSPSAPVSSHRCDHRVLKSTLPPKYEHVLYTRPSEVQMKLYNHAQEQAQTHNKSGTGLNPIVAFSTFTKIWNHPDIFHDFTRSSKEGAVSAATSTYPCLVS